MEGKFHVLFVVSELPIDAGKIEKGEGVRHFISAKVEPATTSGSGFQILKSLPEQANGDEQPFVGRGKSISCVIANWIYAVVSSFEYVPLYIRRRKEEKKEIKGEELDK